MPQVEHASEQPAALPEDAASAEIRTLKAENRTLKERCPTTRISISL